MKSHHQFREDIEKKYEETKLILESDFVNIQQNPEFASKPYLWHYGAGFAGLWIFCLRRK
ncbi:MAG: hypothetical protein LBH38_02285 [Holosporales bacterium]|jgi:hypothetical protein|nr:hypothetical protein [Holosporales bacterium]